MKVTRIVAFAVIGASLSIGALHAQTLRSAQTPAEFPPDTFRGAQYVDSKGCVFIRAGIDGNVTWVPRVNRQRRLICGQPPSLSAEAAQAARTAPRASASTQGVEQITLPPSAQTTPAPATQAKPVAQARTTRGAPTPAPKPTVRPRQVTVVTTAKPVLPKTARPVIVARPAPARVRAPVVAAPKVARVPAPKPAPARRASVPQRQAACRGASSVSARYINSGARASVRCGPQPVTRGAATPPPATKAPTTYTTTSARSVATIPGAVGPRTRVVPHHIYEASNAQVSFPVPKGYRPVWEDDRLNPRRAEQSLGGIARTRLLWTQTVPRRLIDRNTGRDMTAAVALVYPFTDSVTQQQELGTVTLVQRDGQLLKRIVRNKARARTPTVSTRSAATPVVTAKAKAQVTPKGRYVQIGTFGQATNARAAAQRILRAGLPARIGKVKRGGKSYQVVLAGPFDTSTALGKGLQQSRAAGFSDAFVR